MDSRMDEFISNPRRHFSGPFEVLDHDELAMDDKRRILESWKLDAQQLADGTAENMTGGEETDLRDVSKALVQLKSMDATPQVARQRKRRGASMVLSVATGAVVGAGAGLVLLSVSTVAPVLTLAQTTLAGGLIGGLVRVFRKTVHV